jgi:hypothetical protein
LDHSPAAFKSAFLKVCWTGIKNHDLYVGKIQCRGKNRKELALKVASFGAVNVQVENILLNKSEPNGKLKIPI